ncbi:MAG: NAD+ synthase [Maricaulaceae bacterium]|jgi:NAD+ synthase
MTDALKIASAQFNPIVGDVWGNADKVREARAQGAAAGADLVVCPELCLIGYPPEDLVLKPAAVDDCMSEARRLARETSAEGPALVIGSPWRDGGVYNAVLLLDEGEIKAVRAKHELPNYGVFDEKRVFAPGPLPEPVEWRGLRLGLPVCEDIWYQRVPHALLDAGAELLICINGSPWRRTIQLERPETFGDWFKSAANPAPLIFVNTIGGQDELVFDGASFSWEANGEIAQQLPAFVDAFDVADWVKENGRWRCAHATIEPLCEGLEADWRAAVLAVRDYVEKNGFPGVVIGLSGGIDSALTAAMAVDALGPDRVRCVAMPSRYTSEESLEDAAATAKLLGASLETIDIEPAVAAFDAMLSRAFEGTQAGTAEENIQSRIRGVVLMALSNKFGPMVLTTGNKSEMAVGYATLYGDMNGGYNALKDLYKTEVFALARWRNGGKPAGLLGPDGAVMPERVVTKPPSAELRADQKDEDSLPPYEVLDDILRGLVDREEEIEAIVARGHPHELVERVQHLVYVAEYKRRQAPPGAKIGGKNFGRDRRYPITNKYRDRLGD